MATLRIGRFVAPLPFNEAGPYLGYGSEGEIVSQEEWEASESRKKLWIGAIVTAILVALTLKP